MPPFSADICHQVEQYIANDNSGHAIASSPIGRMLTSEGEEAAFLGLEQVHEDFALKISNRANKGLIIELQDHFSYHYSQFKPESEEKDDTEANVEPDLDTIEPSFEAKKLYIDSVRDDQVYEHNSYGYHGLNSNNMYIQSITFALGANIGIMNASTRSLFVIPEQRVSFARKVVGGFMLDDVQVQLIPHVNEYTLEDKRSMWYTRSELKTMRKSCFRTAKLVSKDAELNCPYFIRGLEHLVEQYHHLYHSESEVNNRGDDIIAIEPGETDDDKITYEKNSDKYFDSSSTSESRRWDAVESVLFEQDRQQKEFLRKHGFLFGWILDAEKIRSIYRIEGKIRTSQLIAHKKALKDEICAKEWLAETIPSPLLETGAYRYYQDGDSDHYERKISSNGLSRNVRKVFHKLLTPFLELRDGDIYVEMGDEYFLTQA